ncbi:hypothetical protein [Nocardioides montaniterrae]
MLHRRSSAIAAPVLGVLLAASMSACGFHYPTDRVNTISAGVNNRDASVDALGIRVLASAPDQGRLIGALSNQENSDASLSAVSGDGLKVAAFKPVQVAPMAGINLATDVSDPIEVSGTFMPGTTLTNVQLTFTRGGKTETIEMDVPVVKPCHFYTAVPTPSAAASTSAPAKAAKGAKAATATTTPSEVTGSATPMASSSESGSAAFDCEDPSPSQAPAE